MSRSVELPEAQARAFDQQAFKVLRIDMLGRQEAGSDFIEMRFRCFVKKSAPVSKGQIQLAHEVCWRGHVATDGHLSFSMPVAMPVMSLSPRSKEISPYGADKPRSCIVIEDDLADELETAGVV